MIDPESDPQGTTILDAVIVALRSSADVHDAERIPHLSRSLRALADALDHGALVPGPPPGPCPARLELTLLRPDGAGGVERIPERHSCALLATHAGLHTEGTILGPHGPAQGVTWGDPIDPADETDYVEIDGDRYRQSELVAALRAAHDIIRIDQAYLNAATLARERAAALAEEMRAHRDPAVREYAMLLRDLLDASIPSADA